MRHEQVSQTASDGLDGLFYRHDRSVLEEDVFKDEREVSVTGKLAPSLNGTQITHIRFCQAQAILDLF